MAELVAGHSQDNEPLAGVALVELVHLGVIPGGRTSERRDVLNEDHLAPQRGEAERFSRQQVCSEVVEISSHGCIADTAVCPLLPLNFLNVSLVSLVFLRRSPETPVQLSREFTPRSPSFGTAHVQRHGRADQT